MKRELRQSARKLRQQGYAMNEIVMQLKASKASVSLWTRDIELTQKQLKVLRGRPYTSSAIEKRRKSRLLHETTKQNIVIDAAVNDIPKISYENLLLIGVSLYWGEGTKKKKNVVEFTNSDPLMIKVMMEFFSTVCKVKSKKFRGHVFLHEHLSISNAELYWSKATQIPRTQFHKTSIQQNRNRIKKDTLPYGTFAIIVCDTRLRLKIEGWTRGLIKNLFHD